MVIFQAVAIRMGTGKCSLIAILTNTDHIAFKSFLALHTIDGLVSLALLHTLSIRL